MRVKNLVVAVVWITASIMSTASLARDSWFWRLAWRRIRAVVREAGRCALCLGVLLAFWFLLAAAQAVYDGP
jgi:hypothetical protein